MEIVLGASNLTSKGAGAQLSSLQCRRACHVEIVRQEKSLEPTLLSVLGWMHTAYFVASSILACSAKFRAHTRLQAYSACGCCRSSRLRPCLNMRASSYGSVHYTWAISIASNLTIRFPGCASGVSAQQWNDVCRTNNSRLAKQPAESCGIRKVTAQRLSVTQRCGAAAALFTQLPGEVHIFHLSSAMKPRMLMWYALFYVRS